MWWVLALVNLTCSIFTAYFAMAEHGAAAVFNGLMAVGAAILASACVRNAISTTGASGE